MSDAADLYRMFFERSGINLELKQYLLSVTAGALLCAILGKLLPKSGTAGNVAKLLVGLFMALNILAPVGGLQLENWGSITEGFLAEASQAAADGSQQSRDSLAAIIKERCEAYILDKAAQLKLQLTVEVTLSGDSVPALEAVTIRGNASPYARQRLQEIIAQDLGIAKENQLWT